jgi:hypothetical protein
MPNRRVISATAYFNKSAVRTSIEDGHDISILCFLSLNEAQTFSTLCTATPSRRTCSCKFSGDRRASDQGRIVGVPQVHDDADQASRAIVWDMSDFHPLKALLGAKLTCLAICFNKLALPTYMNFESALRVIKIAIYLSGTMENT